MIEIQNIIQQTQAALNAGAIAPLPTVCKYLFEILVLHGIIYSN